MPLHIANLGSSFSAGPSIRPVANKAAGRSHANFASLVARRVGAQLTDLSVSGATLPNLISEPQEARGQVFRPQVEELPADTDVVLVLGGGNDIGYIGGFFHDTLSGSFVGRLLQSLWGAPTPQDTLGTEGLAVRYAKVLDRIHAGAPGARVLVVEYLAMLGPDVRPGLDVKFSRERVEHHQGVGKRVLEATRMAVREREEWCSIVPVAEPSESHAIGSKEPWVSGFSWMLFFQGGVYHPNVEGMKAVSELVYQRMVELGLVEAGQ